MLDVYSLLSVAFFLNGFGWFGYNILIAHGRVKLVALIYLFLPIFLVGGCIFFVAPFGMVGVALAVTFARCVDIVLFVIGSRVAELRLSDYLVQFKEVGGKLLIVFLLMISIKFIASHYETGAITSLCLGGTSLLAAIYWLYSKYINIAGKENRSA